MIFGVVETFLSTLFGKLNEYIFSVLMDFLVALWLSIVAIIRGDHTVAPIRGFYGSLDALQEFLHDTKLTNKELPPWVEKAEDLAYEVEDLLDVYETMQRLLMERSWISVLPVYLKYYKVFDEAKAITKKLIEFNQQQEEFSLLRTDTGVPPYHVRPSQGCLLTEPILFGRESEMAEIMNRLLGPNHTGETFDIIPIVGMGGLGKTTLVQHVYEDEQVTCFFQVKAWSCASMELDRCRILKQLAGSRDSDLFLLERQVHDMFRYKKFLVVIDDLHSTSVLELDRLLAPLMSGAPGSKIIITARDSRVASCIRTEGRLFKLGVLSDEDCWSLFCERSGLDVSANSKLVKLSKAISKKCEGLPLAAVILGSLLRGNENVMEWEKVLHDQSLRFSTGEAEIHDVLLYSYWMLPYCQRRCFAYCTIFPKNYIFRREELIYFWMSAGLLKCGGDWKYMGEVYFDELVSRSFLLCRGDGQYVMHALIRDVGRKVCGSRYLAEERMADNSPWISRDSVRHVAMDMSTEMPSVEYVREPVVSLRSLMLTYSLPGQQEDSLRSLLMKLRTLRLLSVQNFKTSQVLQCLGEMKHLRSLFIQCDTLTELPLGIGELSKLLFLTIYNCPLLKKLPSEMRDLSSLLAFEIRECPLLIELPSQLGSLGKLLSFKLIGCSKLSNLPSEIGRLCSLSTLELERCSELTELPSEIGNLGRLSTLLITHCSALTNLPSDIGRLSSLCEFHVENCRRLTRLPSEIGSLTSLSSLHVYQCPMLAELPLQIGSLSSLKNLRIQNCLELRELPSEIRNLSNLSKFRLYSCSLKALPSQIGDLTSLSSLDIQACPLTVLPLEIGSLRSLSRLIIWNCQCLTILPREIWTLSNLSILGIGRCLQLTDLGLEMGSSSSLTTFMIKGSPRLTVLPSEIGNLSSLCTLILCDLDLVEKLPPEIQKLTNLSTLYIGGFPQLLELPQEIGRLSRLSTLYIDDCPRLTELPKTTRALSHLSVIYTDALTGLTDTSTYGKPIKTATFPFKRYLLWDDSPRSRVYVIGGENPLLQHNYYIPSVVRF